MQEKLGAEAAGGYGERWIITVGDAEEVEVAVPHGLRGVGLGEVGGVTELKLELVAGPVGELGLGEGGESY